MESSRFSRRVRDLFARNQRSLDRAAGLSRGVSVEAGVCMESFEPRTLLAAVVWDGGAGTNNWHDAANWDRGGVNAVPVNGDDVIIMAAGTPTITFSTGTLTLASLVTDDALTVSGGTLELQPTAAADINAVLMLLGGTISGGTWDFAGGTLRGSSSGGTISNAQINGDVLLDSVSATVRFNGTTRFTAARLTANNATTQFTPGYTLNDLVVVEGAAAGARNVTGGVGAAGNLTIGASGVIRLAANSGGNLTINNSSQVTIINNGLISAEAPTRSLTFSNSVVTNNAVIQALAGALDVSPTTLTNLGSITATGATLTLGGAWSSSGTITVNNSTLNLAGTFTPAGLVINRTGGAVNLTGTMNNTGNTFTFNAASGSWNLSGGGVTGGTLVFTGADRLAMTASGGTLTDVQVNGDLVLDSTSSTVRITGATRFTAARLSANNAGVQFLPGYTLNDLVVAEGATIGGRSITGGIGGAGNLTIGATGIIRLAANSGGNLNINNSSLVTIINNGLVSAESSTRSLVFNNAVVTNNAVMQANAGVLDVSPTTLTNAGSITATNATLTLGGTWSNSGTITETNSTVNLAGTFTSTGLAVNRTGGTINVTGTMTHTGNTFTFNATTGSWNLSGGTVNGGTLIFTGANRLAITSGGGTLMDVQVDGELIMDTTSSTVKASGSTRFTAARLTANNASIQFAPGYTLNDLVVAEGAAIGSRSVTGAVGGAGTLTIGATGVIRLAAGSGGNLNINNSSLVTVINNGLISAEAAGRTLSFGNASFTNNAVAQASAGTLDITPTTWTNAGSVTGANATLTLGGMWSSSGTIVATNSTVNLAGVFSTAGFALSRTGGVVNITGTMNNTGNTFTFTPTTGAWNLSGGSITGGTLVSSGIDRLLITSAGGLLQDVQVNAELLMDTTSSTVRIAGTTRFIAARLTANNAGIQFAPGYTLSDLVVAEGAVTGTRSVSGGAGGAGTLTIGATGVIRLGASSGGNLTISNNSLATIINNGLISAEAPGRTLTFSTAAFTNNATTQVIAGVLDISPASWTNPGTLIANNATATLAGAWSSSGQIQATNATVNLAGAFNSAGFTLVRTGGQINITGVMTNTGNTITFTPSTGSWNLSGGTITGGALNMTGADRLVPTTSGGSLNDVQVNGDLVVDQTSATVRVNGTTRFTAARLTANNAGIQFATGYTLNDLVVAEGAAPGTRAISGGVGGVGTLTISPTGAIRVAPGSGGGLSINDSNQVTLINNGTIAAEANGRALSITVNTLQNVAKGVLTGGTWIASGSSALTLPNGVVVTTNNANVTVGGAASFPALATLRTNNGSLSTAGGGAFTITPDAGTLVNNGTITLRPTNTLAIVGNFTQAVAANFVVQVQGDLPADIGRLTVTGAATLDGILTIAPVNGWSPECINSVFITAGSVVGQFAAHNLPAAPADHQTFIVYLGEVRFAISPPSDYNRDGFLNSQDIFDFLVAFFEQSNDADFNDDGFVNSQDFFDFIADFFEGCP